ncbi:intradiol ring-cleavage dioxygenase [Halomonas nitroreducens]|uniref:Hydroxyquinol 1,2-dioxygenase n=1 Tax=Halomonas nitroreducens TaxID=447425 RepID=A0A3S0K0J0_9GAMM|nr:intradiol ring-cleavage dioxygenase [Halomonas nitroreducens]RTQ98903.1 hydroxyquinol 1,2-dioxygenase [Halomonas nitroreducens]
MRNLNANNITDAVIEEFSGCRDERLKTILNSLVTHLHAFLREVEPTEQEWTEAIDFLTRTGQMCDDQRQEFILLSDTLGVTMLVDALNHQTSDPMVSESTVLGPFYVPDPPQASQGESIDWNVEGEPFLVEGRVHDELGQPLANVVVDVWQSDSEGFYDVQKELESASLRARFTTDDQGRYAFWTVTPAPYPIPTDGPVGKMLEITGRHPYRPAHVHFMLMAEGFDTLVTQVFAEDDPYLDSDAVFGVKDSLVKEYKLLPPGRAPDGRAMEVPFRHLTYDFGLKASR